MAWWERAITGVLFLSNVGMFVLQISIGNYGYSVFNGIVAVMLLLLLLRDV